MNFEASSAMVYNESIVCQISRKVPAYIGENSLSITRTPSLEVSRFPDEVRGYGGVIEEGVAYGKVLTDKVIEKLTGFVGL